MLNTSITHHSALPDNLRRSPGYDYLTTHHLSYWRHAVDVAHQLLEAHEEVHGHAVYYQDDFRDHFKHAIKRTDLDPSARVLGPFMLNQSLGNEEKITDPQWIAYREARAELITWPRGTALVFKSYYSGGEHWEANAHQGGSNITNCNTMARGQQAATREQIWNNILSYESYLARKQAETERTILANYARIRELKLCRGMHVQDYEIMFEGRYRKMRFVISEIYESGRVELAQGKMRGSNKVFAATTDAVCFTAANIAPVETKKPPIASPDALTLALF